MSSELKPCPFCGGKAALLDARSYRRGLVEDPYYVGCECGAQTYDYDTPLKATEAWNTRHERTCLMVYREEYSGDELYPTECYQCQECGCVTNEGKPNYCPNCGAKVVGK